MAYYDRLMLVKNLSILFLFGVLMWLCPLSSCRCPKLTFLNLRGMNASQVSTYQHLGVYLTADLAIDGDSRATVKFSTCSHTRNNVHPWWKVDLGTNHCIGRVTLVNRDSMYYERYNGTIVRAGLESDLFKNAACGLPVTWDQASIPGAHIPILCEPPVIARYVSVDDDELGVEPKDSLTLCELMVEEYPMKYCLQSTTAMALDPAFASVLEGKCVANPSPLSVNHIKSPVQCFLRCKMSIECWYFDYVMTSGQCRLYDVKAGDLKTDDQPGCLVYAVVRG
ncbi:pentraxin fusion protein-like [Asterias amurensis]|uniref:pentraxin fusion protein-like n=1 Tax=Asterias amurensis TaxID=7602 RepID=UPI003AB8F953